MGIELMGKCIVLTGNVETFGRFNWEHRVSLTTEGLTLNQNPQNMCQVMQLRSMFFSAVQRAILKTLLEPICMTMKQGHFFSLNYSFNANKIMVSHTLYVPVTSDNPKAHVISYMYWTVYRAMAISLKQFDRIYEAEMGQGKKGIRFEENSLVWKSLSLPWLIVKAEVQMVQMKKNGHSNNSGT